MADFWFNVLAEIVASLIQWLVIISLSAIAAAIYVLSRRGRFLRFFGISSILENPTVRIYMSVVYVREGGAMSVDGSVARIYQGATVVVDEFLELDTLTSLFKPPTMFSLIPPALLKVLERWSMNFTQVQVIPRPCPLDPNELQGGVLILIGGPQFNAGTLCYLERGGVYLQFLPNKAGVKIVRGRSARQKVTPQGEGMNTAIIQKQTYPDEGRIVFFLAGTGANGTRAAIRYLKENWERLYKRYKEDDFGICIQCESRRQNSKGYQQFDVLRIVPSE